MNDSQAGFGTLHMPRSRGAVSGLLLIILGVWGALVPFVGPYFHFAYTPGEVWVWSTARAWLEVFPGVVAAVGGFLLLVSGNRATAMFGGWLAVIARRVVRRRSHAGADASTRRRRPPDRRDGRQARGDRDRVLLRAGRTHRLLRWSGAGAGVGPHGSRRGIRDAIRSRTCGARLRAYATDAPATTSAAAPTEVIDTGRTDAADRHGRIPSRRIANADIAPPRVDTTAGPLTTRTATYKRRCCCHDQDVCGSGSSPVRVSREEEIYLSAVSVALRHRCVLNSPHLCPAATGDGRAQWDHDGLHATYFSGRNRARDTEDD